MPTSLLDNPHTIRSAQSIFEKKVLPRLVFKKIVVKEGSIRRYPGTYEDYVDFLERIAEQEMAG